MVVVTPEGARSRAAGQPPGRPRPAAGSRSRDEPSTGSQDTGAALCPKEQLLSAGETRKPFLALPKAASSMETVQMPNINDVRPWLSVPTRRNDVPMSRPVI